MQPVVNQHPSVQMLEQLGGHRFVVMTGAKEFVSGDTPEPMLRFRLPSNLTKNRGTHFQITLDATDTYRLAFFKMRKGERQLIDGAVGVYCDDLQRQFTALTGLDTRL